MELMETKQVEATKANIEKAVEKIKILRIIDKI